MKILRFVSVLLMLILIVAGLYYYFAYVYKGDAVVGGTLVNKVERCMKSG